MLTPHIHLCLQLLLLQMHIHHFLKKKERSPGEWSSPAAAQLLVEFEKTLEKSLCACFCTTVTNAQKLPKKVINFLKIFKFTF